VTAATMLRKAAVILVFCSFTPLAWPTIDARPATRPVSESATVRPALAHFPQSSGLLWSVSVVAIANRLDPLLVAAVVMVESSGNPAAVNGRCVGLMQVNMSVWRRALNLDPARMMEPRYNLRAGCAILLRYLAIERGDVRRALRRYHGGESWRYADRVLATREGMR
jgi:soluble lytic murein transglycosylase-like protein